MDIEKQQIGDTFNVTTLKLFEYRNAEPGLYSLGSLVYDIKKVVDM